jgi:hypothetical protein
MKFIGTKIYGPQSQKCFCVFFIINFLKNYGKNVPICDLITLPNKIIACQEFCILTCFFIFIYLYVEKVC